MQPKIVEQPEFSIIGIQVRTSNAREMTGQGDIPKQWTKFYKEGIADKIPHKVRFYDVCRLYELRQRLQR